MTRFDDYDLEPDIVIDPFCYEVLMEYSGLITSGKNLSENSIERTIFELLSQGREINDRAMIYAAGLIDAVLFQKNPELQYLQEKDLKELSQGRIAYVGNVEEDINNLKFEDLEVRVNIANEKIMPDKFGRLMLFLAMKLGNGYHMFTPGEELDVKESNNENYLGYADVEFKDLIPTRDYRLTLIKNGVTQRPFYHNVTDLSQRVTLYY